MPVELDTSAPDSFVSHIADKIHMGYDLTTDPAPQQRKPSTL
jgi:hypothetical protein